ncbi:MAG: aminotransferase class V-fold PLP-dependent enzyme [Phycisphaerales bacterium]|nr:aminotransferase class V-fold PLP-dependent enzyme [Phycisphaerales bacterium]
MDAHEPGPLARHWSLDPEMVHLNHGSFGAVPSAVLERQSELRDRMERDGMRFLVHDLEGLLDEARAALGAFVGCDPDDLAFVPNATAGVNTVVRSLAFGPGDELLAHTQEYNACLNALRYVAERSGASVVLAETPFPLADGRRAAAAVMERLTPRTRLVMLSHVTSPTGLVWPIGPMVRELEARGVAVLVDGAHAPGMLPLELDTLGASYYTGNCHKWLCTPKGSAFLHVRRDRQGAIRPLSISHGANSARTDRSRFRLEADWLGTADPTAWLCIPFAIGFMASLVGGGWPALMARNRALALRARQIVCAAVGLEPPCPDEMIGTLAAFALPPARRAAPPGFKAHLFGDALAQQLVERRRTWAPAFPWPAPPRRIVRVSAQVYNDEAQYHRFAADLRGLLDEGW